MTTTRSIFVFVLTLLICSAGAGQQRTASRAVTFSETIAPILYENCVTCHRPGEAAPFSLISYEDVKKRGALIATVTQSRYMPPWHAVHGYGDFVGERGLSDERIATIGEWVKQGMPQGDLSKMPKLPEFAEGWHLGKPDLILEMPASYEVPADGPDIFRNFAVPTGLKEDKWVRAVEFRPSARKVVHHALFAYVRGGAVANLDGKDGKPGFNGMSGLGLGVGQGMDPSGPLGGWAVGTTAAFLPDGQAFPLAKGSDLIIQMHFHPTGKTEAERSAIGIYFADKAPDRTLVGDGLPALFAIGSGISIPPGEKNYAIRDSMTLKADVRVYGVGAHAHFLGKDFKATATLPDGTTKPLLWINNWDFNWQEQYFYKEPISLPKGTRIDATITYDNSTDNPKNPNNPPKQIWWGQESFDEMGGIGFMMVAVRKEDERVLQADLQARSQAAIASGLQNGSVRRFLDQNRRSQAAASPQAIVQQIQLFDRQGNLVRAVGEPGLYSQAALSPDASRVVVIKNDLETRSTDVWIFDVATGDSRRVVSDTTSKSAPVWSPDGKQIAYVSTVGSQSSVYRKAADGSGTPELLYKPTPGAALVLTDWSSGLICFWSGMVTYALPVEGNRKPIELFHEAFNVRGGRFSPDGRFFGYNSDESGKFQAYAGSFNASAVTAMKGTQVSIEPAAGGIVWRQDGKEMYFLALPPQQAVMAADIDTSNGFHVGKPRLLFKVPSAILAPAQLSSISSRDGERFVFLQQVTRNAR